MNGWKVVTVDEDRVRAVYNPYSFRPGVNVACCGDAAVGLCDGPPAKHGPDFWRSHDFFCGFHSTVSPFRALMWGLTHAGSHQAVVQFGLSGRVIEGALGYVSAEATPLAVLDTLDFVHQDSFRAHVARYFRPSRALGRLTRVVELGLLSHDDRGARMLGVPVRRVAFDDIDDVETSIYQVLFGGREMGRSWK